MDAPPRTIHGMTGLHTYIYIFILFYAGSPIYGICHAYRIWKLATAEYIAHRVYSSYLYGPTGDGAVGVLTIFRTTLQAMFSNYLWTLLVIVSHVRK